MPKCVFKIVNNNVQCIGLLYVFYKMRKKCQLLPLNTFLTLLIWLFFQALKQKPC